MTGAEPYSAYQQDRGFVSVRPVQAGYEIVMGERRFRACQLLGFTHIDAFVLSANGQETALLALIENLQRENLHYFEEAEAMNLLPY